MSAILDSDGRPFKMNGHAQDLAALFPRFRQQPREQIEASYDAAQTTPDNQNHWAAADIFDADSANLPLVRRKLVMRSRYEAGSNGYYDGILQSHANFLCGVGPTLHMQ